MVIRRFVILTVALAAAACGRPAGDVPGSPGATPASTGSPGASPSPSTATPPAPRAASPSGGKPVNSAAVYEIHLESPAPGAIRATLRNTSGAVQHVLHDAYRQPSTLELVDAAGHTVEAFDTRTVKKFNAAIEREQYADLAAGKEMVLFDEKVTTGDRGKLLRWGPYELSLRPGTYKARVVWKSATTSYEDDTGAKAELPGVWVGTVSSNTVDLRVP